MPTAKLTQRFVDNLTPTGTLICHFDTALTGFGIYTKGKAKTYFVQGRAERKLIKTTIGKASVLSLDEARREAKSILAQMAKGINPVAQKRKEVQKGMTLEKCLEKFLKARPLKPRTIQNYKDVIRLFMSDWVTKPIGSITKDMIADRHKKVGERTGAASANGLMRTFRALYNYARTISEGAIPENPVERLSQTRQWYKVERRRTFLKPHELKPWHDAVMKIENLVIRDYLLLNVFTGLRKMEGLTMKWTDVDMQDKSFTITDTKNGKPHTLPMSNQLYGLFEQLKARRLNDYVFPGSGKAGHLVEPKKQLEFIEIQTQLALNNVTTKEEINKKITDDPDNVLPGIKFCLHDLRRTFITVAESLDIPYAALKRLLNHSDGNDVTGGYLQITTDRLRDPMERISSKLMELMGNV